MNRLFFLICVLMFFAIQIFVGISCTKRKADMVKSYYVPFHFHLKEIVKKDTEAIRYEIDHSNPLDSMEVSILKEKMKARNDKFITDSNGLIYIGVQHEIPIIDLLQYESLIFDSTKGSLTFEFE